MAEQFFSIEATAKFFGVDEATICSWLRRQELIATLRGHQLTVGVDAIAETIRRFPERQPMGLPGVQRQRLKRIVTSENRGQLPSKGGLS
jgi:hypothetical protein